MHSTPPPDAMLQLLTGLTTPEQFSERFGLPLDEVNALKARGLSRVDALFAPPRPRRRWGRLAVGALAVLVPTLAFAQLVSFVPDTPAKADEVNGNFNQLRTWLEQKVGVVGSNAISTGAVTATSLTSSGTISTASLSSSGAVSAASANLSGALSANSLNITGNAAVGGSLTVNGTATLNGITLRVKNGNNGSVSCDAFCLSSSFNGFGPQGACVGIKLPSGQFSADCGFVAGTVPMGTQVTCVCASF